MSSAPSAGSPAGSATVIDLPTLILLTGRSLRMTPDVTGDERESMVASKVESMVASRFWIGIPAAIQGLIQDVLRLG